MKRMPAKDFQDLIVWQKAHQLVLSVYRFSNNFPKNETYGLTSQTRRAVISILAPDFWLLNSYCKKFLAAVLQRTYIFCTGIVGFPCSDA